MNNPVLDDDQEPPLDPAAERLQRRLKRMLGFSSLIMVAGLIAVFAAILYKVTSREGSMSEAAATISIDPDAEVVDMELSDGRLILLIRRGAATSLIYIDPASGQEIARSDFVAR